MRNTPCKVYQAVVCKEKIDFNVKAYYKLLTLSTVLGTLMNEPYLAADRETRGPTAVGAIGLLPLNPRRAHIKKRSSSCDRPSCRKRVEQLEVVCAAQEKELKKLRDARSRLSRLALQVQLRVEELRKL